MEVVIAAIGYAVGRFSLHVEGTDEKYHKDDTSDGGGLRSVGLSGLPVRSDEP